MTQSSISVAMCTYNRDYYLQQQLDSYASQTQLPDELVVCDDGSTDSTLEILENFQRTAPFPVRIIRNEQNLGITKNFEKCISLCKGDFIALSDSDDEWYPRKLEILSSALETQKDAAYAIANADLMDDFGFAIKGTLYRKGAFRLTNVPRFPFEIREKVMIKGNVVYGSSTLMRAGFRKLIFPLPKDWFHDHGIALLSCFAGSYGIAIEDRLMRYRLHSTQAIGALPPIWKPQKFLAQLNSVHRHQWAKEPVLYSDLRNHIYGKPELFIRSSPVLLQLLDRKIAHLQRRELARSSTVPQRWRIAIGELLSGNYHRLSNSWYSLVRDLFL